MQFLETPLNNPPLVFARAGSGLGAAACCRQRETGCSNEIAPLITQRRIQLAQRLMRECGESIAEASHMSEFANQSHFTKSFLILAGAPPKPGFAKLIQTYLNRGNRTRVK